MPKTRALPYLSAALLCEQVMEEKDGVLTPVRIVDRFTVRVPKGTATSKRAAPIKCVLFVGFKGGKALGDWSVAVTFDGPVGSKSPVRREAGTFPLHFDRPEQGHNLVIKLNLLLKEEGLYWFRIHLDKTEVTSVPLILEMREGD